MGRRQPGGCSPPADWPCLAACIRGARPSPSKYITSAPAAIKVLTLSASLVLGALHSCSASDMSEYERNMWLYNLGNGGSVGRKHKSTTVCLGVGVDHAITQIAHNKILVAAAVSAAIGQLSKPFTSAILYGNNFDFKAALQAGGFPSAHSSAVVATATSLGLERGFSDGIFGLAVVYAGLTMYDAQGVRREVGIHAKALNRVLLMTRFDSIPSGNADNLANPSSAKSSSSLEGFDPLFMEEPSSFRARSSDVSQSLGSENRESQSTPLLISSTVNAKHTGRPESIAHNCATLKESVGHSEIEVVAGAFLGFFVGLAFYMN
ncbi:hypothetical protein RJ639_000932 [Escallonia herrerae]|uniref:Acid phosphatase/vanadium-dependent haloperoxidase-related protein n=1 Tax=Escallonia herrerae TaxID=1293975 RepID=A0AA88XQI3_9ASTE|nr:hypothetical protein RJ639_000932 [Escallonia herrerae]